MMETPSIYKPEFYSNLAGLAGHSGFLDQTVLHKAMKDSGFNTMMSFVQKAQNRPMTPLNKTAHIYREFSKEAGWKENVLGLSMLLSPMKSYGDDALLAATKQLGDNMYPETARQVAEAVDRLGAFKRLGASAYGVEGIAKDLARGKANLQTVSKHGLPLSPQGKMLEEQITSLKNNIHQTGDVDLGEAGGVYDKLKQFNTDAEAQILEYPSSTLAKR